MKSHPANLGKISDLTVAHYNERAEAFWEGTKDHDVGQNIAALLQHIKADPPCKILDFGCGPGRDLKFFSQLGHIAVGLEGAGRFVEMARSHSGCEVWHQDFLKLDLPDKYFDGVFANASLFHVPGSELPRVLKELWATLKPGGILFQFQPARQRRGGLESGTLQRIPRYRKLETLHGRRGFRRSSPLLPPGGFATRTATVAGQRLA
ncbi:bifunctional 2-polyprenyl-6-hydroxyphenol methylase/3-demethylubiquinol 3-O-methyltransferase UbiG [Nitrosovibrio sp. Nv6]|uniref:class I SAM-dependent methyltransferase n=1 Tax=Nitrosovibrio sp. Nv6 TaxID=1855340 RepID=UPI0008C61752|nr:class I SAM-dependent methyltransferase [Nitrosovibrio sp. Nv6]SEP09353.1 Methyltransferase domain-containing protein [Nitrosovibrio sp. Nv6]